MDVGEHPLITTGTGLRRKGPGAVVVDDEEEHDQEARDGDPRVGPASLASLDSCPVQIQDAVEPQEVGEGVKDAQPQRQLTFDLLSHSMGDVVDEDRHGSESEGQQRR